MCLAPCRETGVARTCYFMRIFLYQFIILWFQEGVFDGLKSLRKIVLSHNRISHVDLNVFTNNSELVSLNEIWLDYNQLTEMEPWLLIRGQLVPGSFVNLVFNRIRRFTNRLGWNFRCGMPPTAMSINLGDNNIHHLIDITSGFNITSECLRTTENNTVNGACGSEDTTVYNGERTYIPVEIWTYSLTLFLLVRSWLSFYFLLHYAGNSSPLELSLQKSPIR